MSLSIQQVAQLQAEMDAGAPAGGVLMQAGIDQDTYLAAKEGFLRAIADELRGDRQTLSKQYRDAFIAHRSILAQPSRAVAPSTVAASPVTATPEPSPQPAPSKQEYALPSYALPAGPPAIAPPPAAPLPPQAAPPMVSKMKGTMMADLSAPPSAATPFAPRSQSPQPFRAATPSAPFQAAATPAPAAAPNQKQTMAIDASQLSAMMAQRSSVPFAAGAPAPSPSQPGPNRVDSGTMAVDVDALAGAAALSAEEIVRHASANADISLAREPEATILARWGFDQATKRAFDARWTMQMVSDTEARAKWLQIYKARKAAFR